MRLQGREILSSSKQVLLSRGIASSEVGIQTSLFKAGLPSRPVDKDVLAACVFRVTASLPSCFFVSASSSPLLCFCPRQRFTHRFHSRFLIVDRCLWSCRLAYHSPVLPSQLRCACVDGCQSPRGNDRAANLFVRNGTPYTVFRYRRGLSSNLSRNAVLLQPS